MIDSPFDNPQEFARIRGLEEAEEDRTVRWETRILQKIANRFKMSKLMSQIRVANKESTGKTDADIASFDSLYPSFPLRLVARKLPYIVKVSVADLFRRPTTLGPWKLYLELVDAAEAVGDPRDVTFVFDWPKLTAMALTTYPFSSNEVRCFCSGLVGQVGRPISMVRFDDLLRELTWEP